MPPRTAVRFAWSSKKSFAQVNSALCARSFTSTSPSLALGPESPSYIEVPKPLQPTYPPKPRIKGVLPVPRDVFDTRSKVPKESDEFIKAATRDKRDVRLPPIHSRDAEYQLYKRRLAEARKTAFRQGVKELHERKTTTDARQSARLAALRAEKRALAMAPPRGVDVLTAASTSKNLRDFLESKLPSTSRSHITEGRRRAYERRMAKRASTRQARLHDLYINAREFIVDEEQLDEAIDKEFGTEDAPVGWDNTGKKVVNGENRSPWRGPVPEGVSDLLQKLRTGEGVDLAERRMKKIAEELTGGKM
ncbi:hypothetical protein CC78DRAFT_538064 [Lojkania enalia]|uniref:Uncharacterized protein n=1 Tax=Lojkania enalia TaxID=147567 RepID=A0A9P4N4B1_9PLEO|nr:hypothetical protein CC78DRAFT_538064 [Didymosphaeria enalia]